jgi:hypothetical protein
VELSRIMGLLSSGIAAESMHASSGEEKGEEKGAQLD